MSLLDYKRLRIYNTTLMDELSAIDLSYELNLDIDDSIQYHVATILKADGIVSFDRHFDGLKNQDLNPPSSYKPERSDPP
ncbi:hypothetical protein KEJ13_05610 [Candidatus Bathyarchaeota archaeon]|nr:hypothetical protein [Candidatus Bathyarchaeota archaeon]